MRTLNRSLQKANTFLSLQFHIPLVLLQQLLRLSFSSFILARDYWKDPSSVYENLNRYEFIPIWYKFIPIWYKFIPGWYWLILEFGCFNLTQNSGPNFGTWMWKNFFNLSFRDWVIGLYPRMIDLVWYKFIPVWYKIVPDWYNFIPDWYKFVPIQVFIY